MRARGSPASSAAAAPVEASAGPDDPGELARWYAATALAVVRELETKPADRVCWTLGEPSTVAFWIRRQAHETTVHRWDAERALGLPARIDHPTARDGVAEVVEVMLPRQLRLGRLDPELGSVLVDLASDDGHADAVPVGVGAPVATVSTDPATALLLLWRRVGPEDPRIVISGDRTAASRVLRAPLTP